MADLQQNQALSAIHDSLSVIGLKLLKRRSSLYIRKNKIKIQSIRKDS